MRPAPSTSKGQVHIKGYASLAYKAQDSLFLLALTISYTLMAIYRVVLLYFHRAQFTWNKISYHQNRAPDLIGKDVASLPKIPRHVAAILKLDENKNGGGLTGLLDQTSALAAWCMGAEIPCLTIYERHGVLKALDPEEFKRRISKKLQPYFGTTALPSMSVKIPPVTAPFAPAEIADLAITLISEEDGRQSLVDLTRTLSSLALLKKIDPKDITIESIDTELKQTGADEPDLVIVFGPTLDLDGFPPWQMRLSEIFHLADNTEVSYPVFLQGLESYAGCKINVGR